MVGQQLLVIQLDEIAVPVAPASAAMTTSVPAAGPSAFRVARCVTQSSVANSPRRCGR